MMDAPAYPGQGLSLSQLVFALNEELKRVAYCSSFTFDMVSQLDKDTSVALANIREWRNTFVPINRFPLEVLCNISTQLLPNGKDVSNACYVCRHWHRSFVQHAVLWSSLNLTLRLSDRFIKARLERAKGSALDITCTHLEDPDRLALLAPHAQRFQNLRFIFDLWSCVQKFSEATSGPLPLLHSLTIHIFDYHSLFSQETPLPSTPLFAGAVNLKDFSLCTKVLPFLDRFTFPNLTTFELSTILMKGEETFPASQLLDFLETTPALKDARLEIQGDITLASVLPGRVVVLPNVEKFSVIEEGPGHNIATHVSCPISKRTSLIHEHHPFDTDLQEAFFNSNTWNAIPPQFAVDHIDEVVLESITSDSLSCSLSLLLPGPSTLELGYRIAALEEEEDDDDIEERPPLENEHALVFSLACKTVRDHPQVANVKRLHIQDWHHPFNSTQLERVANAIGRLFKSMGPLEELTLGTSDLRPYLAPFIDFPNFDLVEESYAYPKIKVLTIADLRKPLEADSESAIVEFAKSQHLMGVPFERVVFRVTEPSADTVERLQLWVDSVQLEKL